MKTILNTKYPIDFAEHKAKTKGLEALSDLEKSYYFLGKEIIVK